MQKVFTASNPREIIEEMDRRLKKAGMSQVNKSVEKTIRKRCKYPRYNLFDFPNFLIIGRQIKYYTMQEFICFQIAKNANYYKETEFNPRFAAILVDENGTIYRYLPHKEDWQKKKGEQCK